MVIKDRIHGSVEITSPVIIDLIQSSPLQRLKKISQDGATHFIQPIFNANRFEHSFGAWYLAMRFNRPIEEQIACLLHDVPHTAFSHVVDFVMGDENQEYHDRFLNDVVMNSDIPKILRTHGLDIKRVLQKEKYYLLDNRTPELSFDRWDYFMRDANMMGLLPHETIREIIASVELKDGQFYFTDHHYAGLLCIVTMAVCKLGYVSATSHGAWFLLANALKNGLASGVISEDDLFTTDEEVLIKLKKSHNKEINDYIERLKSGREFTYADKATAEFYGKNKARYIDPLVIHDNKLIKISEIVPGLRQQIEQLKADCQYIGVRQIEV
jgi:uncharacterized protein